MSLQMQLRRGVIAMVIGLALGGVAIGGAAVDGGNSGDAVGAQGIGAVIRAVHSDGSDCDASLRIEVGRAVHVTVPCDLSCAPVSRVLDVLHVASVRQSRCTLTRTA
jgi:hypothetical protein